MPSITIYSANIGGIDHPQFLTEQTIPLDFIKFTGMTQNNRFQSKYWKTAGIARNCQSDIAIWIDGGVDVISDNFVEFVIDSLKGVDFIVAKHPDRATLKEEYDYILANLGKPYLKARYKKEPWAEEMEYYEDNMGAELVNPRFFALRINDKTNSLLEDWWEDIERFTVFDQSQLTALLDINFHGVMWKTVTWGVLDGYLGVKKHKELI